MLGAGDPVADQGQARRRSVSASARGLAATGLELIGPDGAGPEYSCSAAAWSVHAGL